MFIFNKLIFYKFYYIIIGKKRVNKIKGKLNLKKIKNFCEKYLTRVVKFNILSFPNAGERIGDD